MDDNFSYLDEFSLHFQGEIGPMFFYFVLTSSFS